MHNNLFNEIISLENLFLAWDNFKRGKSSRIDIQAFEMELEENIFALHEKLKNFSYKHGGYSLIRVYDTKPRKIHKAKIIDRLVHQAIFQVVYPIFDKMFIYDSYSCRNDKGTHRAVFRLHDFIRKGTGNYNKKLYFLKFDITKYFNNIDHNILLALVGKEIGCKRSLTLIEEIINSFNSRTGKGIPLGNITSQLFANIYLHELDFLIKHKLKVKYYIRYCDDFIILHRDMQFLVKIYKLVEDYLKEYLRLRLKIKLDIKKVNQGIDFLGYVTFPKYRLIKSRTKNRMFNNINKRKQEYLSGRIDKEKFNSCIQSYLGLIKHCKGYNLEKKIKRLTNNLDM